MRLARIACARVSNSRIFKSQTPYEPSLPTVYITQPGLLPVSEDETKTPAHPNALKRCHA